MATSPWVFSWVDVGTFLCATSLVCALQTWHLFVCNHLSVCCADMAPFLCAINLVCAVQTCSFLCATILVCVVQTKAGQSLVSQLKY